MTEAPKKNWLESLARTDAAQLIAGWFNPTTGKGDPARDKNAAAYWERGMLIQERDLASLFTWNSLARAICMALPEWGLRNGWDVTSEGDASASQAFETTLRDQYEELGAHEAMLKGAIWGQTFGGGLVLIGANDGKETKDPLDESTLQSIDWLRVAPRHRVVVDQLYSDARREKFGEAAVYKVRELGPKGWTESVFHESRVIRWPGPVTDDEVKLGNMFWDQSILDVVVSALRKHDGMWDDVGAMASDGSQAVWKIKDFAHAASTGLGEKIRARIELADYARSVLGALLLDADKEDFSYVSRAYTGLSELLGQSTVRTAGAAQIPATVLMGQSPAGLNATGESDLELWYARIWAWQTGVALSRHRRLLRLMVLAKTGPMAGKAPPRWTVAMRDPRRLSPMKQHEIRARQAQTDQAYIAAKVLMPQEVALNRFGPEGWSDVTQIDLEHRRKFLAAANDRLAELAVAEQMLDQWLLAPPTGAPAASTATGPGAGGPSGGEVKEPSGGEAPQDVNKRADGHRRLAALVEGHRRANAAGLRFDAADQVAVMVRVPPTVAAELALEGGEKAEDLHVTLAYLGRLGQDVSTADVQRAAVTVRDVASAFGRGAGEDGVGGLVGIVGGLGRFPASATSDGLDVLVALVDVPGLGLLRSALVRDLAEVDVPVRQDHDFTQHVTLAYVPSGAPLPVQMVAPRAIAVDTIELWVGDLRQTYLVGAGA